MDHTTLIWNHELKTPLNINNIASWDGTKTDLKSWIENAGKFKTIVSWDGTYNTDLNHAFKTSLNINNIVSWDGTHNTDLKSWIDNAFKYK